MNIKSFILALLCLGFFAPAMAQNQVDKQGRKQGRWIRTDKDGSKIYQGTFKDNLEVDTFTYFYPNGNIRIRNVYSVPGKVCQHQAFDEQGHMLATGIYNQKNRDGEWRLYNEQGRLVKIATYRMGIREGLQVIFNSKGDTAEVSYFKDNHRDGRWWKRVDENGYITATYKMGNLEGRLVEYEADGKMAREGYYKDGVKHGTYRYYENGKMTVDENWQNGVLSDRKILINAPEPMFVSINSIAYYFPKGSDNSILYTKDGKKLTAREDVGLIGYRMRSENFSVVDKKNRITVNTTCVMGVTKDEEGRVILDLDPKPAFNIFPDEDGLKMVESLRRENELDEK